MRPDTASGIVVRKNVQGAPLRIGARVRIEPSSLDDTADERFAGRTGYVSGYVYDSPEDQYPHHPLLLVTVEVLGEELFFPDELRARALIRVRSTEVAMEW